MDLKFCVVILDFLSQYCYLSHNGSVNYLANRSD